MEAFSSKGTKRPRVSQKEEAGETAAEVPVPPKPICVTTLSSKARASLLAHSRISREFDVPTASLGPAELEAVRRELTASPRKSDYCACPEPPYPLYVEAGSAISVPRAYGLARWGRPRVDVSDDGVPLEPQRCAFKGQLRTSPPQEEAVRELCRALSADGASAALLNFPCGYGKTTCAAAVISRVRRRTLVVVGRSCLLAQWTERLGQFLPALRVGVIQGPRTAAEDCDVVVAMLQTLASRKPDLRGFGLVVLDEAHHVAARTWAEVQRRLLARRRLSLTATLRRGDGLGRALGVLLGPVTFSVTRPPDDSVQVSRVVVPAAGRREIVTQGRVAIAQMVNQLAVAEQRLTNIARVVEQAVRKGHHVIVLSDRIGQLESLQLLLDAREVNCALLVGQTKPAAREAALEARAVLASYGLAAEGLDRPSLSALVMATPRGDVEQAVGRVLRVHPGKLAPEVFDFVDDYSVFASQAEGRERFYSKFGYSVQTMRCAH